MCKYCENYENLCLVCGNVTHPDWNNVIPYVCERRNIKGLLDSSSSDCFVWIMKLKGSAVKVGCGSLRKLFNETLPNPRYCRFDSVILYCMNNVWDRNEFATLVCGLVGDGIVNRQGWSNYNYCKVSDLILPPAVQNPIDAFGEPDFYIGDTPYWDYRKLQFIGIKRRKIAL